MLEGLRKKLDLVDGPFGSRPCMRSRKQLLIQQMVRMLSDIDY